jgi:FkbM family methyltransferase
MPVTSIIQKQQFKVHYRPGTADEEVLKESFEHDLFLTGVPEYKIKSHHIIVDVGAHIGCFSLLAAGKATKGKIYSFEPSAETHQLLEKNVQANHLTNITTFQSALAAKDGTTSLYHDTVTGNWGHTITKAISAETETVNCMTVETFIKSEGIGRIDFMKFNCEGAEYSILLNTSPVLLQRIKCMLILYHGYLEESYSEKQLTGYLSNAGFKIHHRFRNKKDDSGWLIVYRAGFFENVLINLRTFPLRTSLFIKEIKRKFRRAKEIILKKS